MILIADSGSTKTTWCLVHEDDSALHEKWHTDGINPFYQDEKTIFRMLEKTMPSLNHNNLEVHFYGAGCSGEAANKIVYGALLQFFNPASITVDSDLMAAARSLCQHEEGLACIMGTGSNSCFYDGSQITYHVPALGYILGDEGSGADIGRRLVADVLKNQLPPDICNHFLKYCGLGREEILAHVYKHPFPNRFLAGFAPYVAENTFKPPIYQLVKTGFDKFFRRNISQYPQAATLPVHFTGSIAWHFRDILAESARDQHFTIGKICPDPMEGLMEYYSEI
jgi:glucosamine kinase